MKVDLLRHWRYAYSVMKNPFIFKEIVSGESFFNRKEELSTLETHIVNRQNVVIMAPRRYGKTSLIEKKISELGKDYILIRLDLFKINSLNEFTNELGNKIVLSQKSPFKKLSALIAKGLPSLAPKLTFSSTGEPEFSIDVQSPAKGLNHLEELLFWFDQIESKPKLIFFDEFQELIFWPDHEQIEKGLRSIIQRLKNISFIFSGSSPSLISDMFNKKNRAFYQSTLKMELNLTPLSEAKQFLMNHFKSIQSSRIETLINQIVSLTQGHPYYLQLAGYYLWENLNSEKKKLSDNDIILKISSTIVRQEQNSFESILSPLSHLQRQTLRAICKEPNQPALAKDFLKKHHLGAASSVQKSLATLLKTGIILRTEKGYMPSDPLFGFWLIN